LSNVTWTQQISSPEDYIIVNGHLTDRHPLYYASLDANITGIYPLPKAQMTLDLKKPYFRMSAVHGKGTKPFIILIVFPFSFSLFHYFGEKKMH